VPMYCFRVPFTMSDGSLLGIEDTRFYLVEDDSRRVWLTSTVEEQPLSESTSLVIRGEGFDDEASAAQSGEQWRDVVSRAFARVHLAADFGDRKPFGSLTLDGERMLSEQMGRPVRGDIPGVSAFECIPGTVFVRSEARGCRRPSAEQSRAVLAASAEAMQPFHGAERLAFDLFSGSFFQPSADARLLMLTMAVETLLDLQPRSENAQRHVSDMIAATNANSDLTTSERQSLTSSLQWLMNESIGQAGRRLAATLEPRRYQDLTPSKFFTRCYDMRSALVHGHIARPDRGEVDVLAANLEVFVGHLLSGGLLDRIAD
jgi:hypothetical protein